MPKNKPKILIISTTDCKGGAAMVGWQIGETLRKRGYWVKYIVGYKFSRSPHVYQLSQSRLLTWLDQYSPIRLVPLLRYFRSFLLSDDISFGAHKEILSHPWYLQADVIHCHNLHGSYFNLKILADAAKNKKIIWTLHDMWAITGNCVYTNDPRVWKKGISTKTRMMEYPPMLFDRARSLWRQKRLIYQNAKDLSIVTPSLWLKRRVESSILSGKPSFHIANGINTKVFKPSNQQKCRTALNLPKAKKIVAFVAQGGEHDLRKGWQYIKHLADSYEHNSNIIFLCIGGGRSYQDGNIRYIKNVDNSATLSMYYSASDLFLFTSLAENAPLVILEAMAVGLPIISFDVGGVAEVVKHRINGYVARYQDESDLASGLAWGLSLGEAKLKLMRQQNNTLIQKRYSLKTMVSAYARLYNL